MGAGGIALLAAQGLVGLSWAIAMFRTLFLLRVRASAAEAGACPGPLAFLRELRRWLRDPADRTGRARLGLLTLALVGLTLVFALTRT